MFNMVIGKIGEHKTVNFAVNELRKYLKLMDNDAVIDVRLYDDFDSDVSGMLWVGESPSFKDLLPAVDDPVLDDGIVIKVKNFSGIITGNNLRSVLIAVYRFLTELGVRFVRPGDDGEIIPKHKLSFCDVDICEAPDYRHRTICIEGAVSQTHVRDMIDWVPKVGMNGYFFQFIHPHNNFNRWYSHMGNEYLKPVPYTYEDSARVHEQLISEVTERSLLHHAMGHQWTRMALGIKGNPWEPDSELPEDKLKYIALRGGRREFFHDTLRYTQLCYSDPEVQQMMAEAAVSYIKEHGNIDLLHFWLADSMNNFCECEECAKRLPSDYYVEILNKLDAMLTAENLDTKIVFLSYNELQYAPETARLNNPDRFTLMLAPRRSYSQSFKEVDINNLPELPPYVRNKMPKKGTTETSIRILKNWQQVADCDSFVFEYHLYADHYKDLGYHKVAKMIFDDMQSLEHIGLNGMVSCQLSRVGFPTALPNYAMAKALWNKNCSFEEVEKEYYSAAFGEKGEAVREYLTAISNYIPPEFLRGDMPQWSAKDFCDSALKAVELIQSFRQVISEALENETDLNVRKSWYYLSVHSVYAENCALGWYYGYSGNKEEAQKHIDTAVDYIRRNEESIHWVYDVFKGSSVIEVVGNFDDALF